MNAKLQAQNPPTLRAARETLAVRSRLLLDARRENATARGQLHLLKASGDEAGARRAAATIRSSGEQIEDLVAQVATDEKMIETLIARAAQEGNARRFHALEAPADHMVRSSLALEDHIIQFVGALAEAKATAAAFETALVNCGIPFDAFLSVATRLDPRVELSLWAESGGTFGRARTLESPEQIKTSGLASVHKAASDFRTVTLRDARSKLGYTGEEA
jgi:hypothetical protein